MGIEPQLFTEVETKDILTKEGYGYQIKENGVRAIIHIKNRKIVGVRGRNDLPILYLYPELERLSLPWKEAILDGEIAIYKNGKSVYYGGIDKRRSRKSMAEIEKMEKDGTILRLVVFDALKVDNEILVNKPYSYRYDKIKSLPEAKNVCISKLYFDGQELLQKVIKDNEEGLMAKNLNGIYQMGKRSTADFKLKNYKPAELTVERFEENEKGIKVWGIAKLRDDSVVSNVSCQFANFETVKAGDVLMIKYLDIIDSDDGKKLIQPTKLTPEQYERIK